MKIPTREENPEGLHQRYVVQKVDGTPVGDAVYFVLRLDAGGDDLEHVRACRAAALEYADRIEHHLPSLAADLRVLIARVG